MLRRIAFSQGRRDVRVWFQVKYALRRRRRQIPTLASGGAAVGRTAAFRAGRRTYSLYFVLECE